MKITRFLRAAVTYKQLLLRKSDGFDHLLVERDFVAFIALKHLIKLFFGGFRHD